MNADHFYCGERVRVRDCEGDNAAHNGRVGVVRAAVWRDRAEFALHHQMIESYKVQAVPLTMDDDGKGDAIAAAVAASAAAGAAKAKAAADALKADETKSAADAVVVSDGLTAPDVTEVTDAAAVIIPHTNLQRLCVVCDAPSTNKCAGCAARAYCGQTCQVQHWKTVHKGECMRLRKGPAFIESAKEDADPVRGGGRVSEVAGAP